MTEMQIPKSQPQASQATTRVAALSASVTEIERLANTLKIRAESGGVSDDVLARAVSTLEKAVADLGTAANSNNEATPSRSASAPQAIVDFVSRNTVSGASIQKYELIETKYGIAGVVEDSAGNKKLVLKGRIWDSIDNSLIKSFDVSVLRDKGGINGMVALSDGRTLPLYEGGAFLVSGGVAISSYQVLGRSSDGYSYGIVKLANGEIEPLFKGAPIRQIGNYEVGKWKQIFAVTPEGKVTGTFEPKTKPIPGCYFCFPVQDGNVIDSYAGVRLLYVNNPQYIDGKISGKLLFEAPQLKRREGMLLQGQVVAKLDDFWGYKMQANVDKDGNYSGIWVGQREGGRMICLPIIKNRILTEHDGKRITDTEETNDGRFQCTLQDGTVAFLSKKN